MIRIREVLIVEGKYDVARLRSVVDTLVLDTAGFGIFKDREKLDFFRRLADQRGLLILTDSDSAGFVIRNFLTGALPADRVHHAYIPAIAGKEKRKPTRSKEGLLGVEGMEEAQLEQAIRRSGVTLLGEETPLEETPLPGAHVTKAQLFEDGLSGRQDSRQKRLRLEALCGLPSHLSTNRLLDIINATMTDEQYRLTVDLIS